MIEAEIERRLTTLEVRQDTMLDDLDEIKRELRKISTAMATARGGWKFIAAGVAVATTLGGFITAFWQWFQLRP